MKSSEILREAAQLVEWGAQTVGCIAIVAAAPNNKDRLRALDIFRRYFEPAARPVVWWDTEIAHGPRIIGLCLAAAIAESEGD